ncbi:MAG: restriction endonuclease subunit S [Candidatus Humimicrobiaceae bacterium]
MKKISKNSEFKYTEIGFIPKDWEQVRLGDVVAYIKGKKPTEMIEECKDNYIPYLSTEYLRENKSTKFVRISNEVVLVNNEDLLLLWDGSNAGEFFLGRKGVLSSTMVIFKLKEKKCVRRFLFYSLKTKENYIQGQTKGTGIPHVDGGVLNNLHIFFPPLPEQKKIAEVLSTIDHAIEEVDELISKTEQLKKGLMQKLLTEGIGHEEFKKTEIGKIPEEWNVVEMKDATDINKELIDPIRELSNKNFFYIDIDSVENETGIIKNLREIIGSEAPSRARRQIRYNDVIMSTVRPYLKAFAIIPKPYDNQICSTGFAVLRCKEKILPKFLLYILFSKSLVSQFNRVMVGAQYPALNSSQVKKLKIPLPPISEQKKIAEILSTVDERIQLLKEKKNKLQRVKKGLMNELLTGRKRVKVEI